MRIISIGDVHGRPFWKQIKPDNYDKIIFVGDYVDSYVYNGLEIVENLQEIINLKEKFPEKLELLLGNHDIQYMFDNPLFSCSGYKPEVADQLKELFYSNRQMFNAAYQIDNYLWTHAGVSKGWLLYNEKPIGEIVKKFDTKNLAETFNHMLWLKENEILHQVGDCRGGVHQWGGITWADRRETRNNYLPGIHQIVGHTPLDQITLYGDENGSIRYIDIQNKREFFSKEANFFDDTDWYMDDSSLFYVFELK